jgi:hypothetical protein
MEATQVCTFYPNQSNDDWELVPNSNPKAIFFFGLDGEDYLDHPSLIAMKHCPFCQRLFEPTWDVNFASS